MNASSNRLNIFISSTFSDLKDHRSAVHAAILGLKNHANDMINWSADERTPDELSMDEVKQADLVILILAHRYGTIPPGETRSITEMEYDTAQAEGKPIYVYLIDESFEWPGNKYEWKKYEQLLAFKNKVRQEHSARSFTSPDSLSAQVIQSIVNYDRRHRGWTETARTWTPALTVHKARQVVREADLAIQIGTAEDGLPLVMKITRSDNINQPLSNLTQIVNTFEEAGIKAEFGGLMSEILLKGEKEWIRRGVKRVKLPSEQIEQCYVSKSNLGELFSTPLLGSLLLAPVIGDPLISLRQRGKIATTAGLRRSGREQVGRLESTGGKNRFLGVSLESDRLYVVGYSLKEETQENIHFWHDYYPESLLGFKEVECKLVNAKSFELYDGSIKGYKSNLTRLYESTMDDNGVSEDLHLSFNISRQSIAQAIVQILRNIETTCHQLNVVHGDIKPQNCLITADGAVVIDSLGVQAGKHSYAVSPLWAAPEQIALKTSHLSTDIYPIGLMITSLVSGRLAGEVVRYQIPTRSEFKTVSLLRDPSIFLEENWSVIPLEGFGDWADFIERCLRFDPNERFPSAGVCAAELERVMAKYPLEGSIQLDLDRGSLQYARMPGGGDKLCRVIEDGAWGNVIGSREALASPGKGTEGATEVVTCPNCSNREPAGTIFCSNCGYDLRHVTHPAPPPLPLTP